MEARRERKTRATDRERGREKGERKRKDKEEGRTETRREDERRERKRQGERRKREDQERGSGAMGRTSGFFASGGENRTVSERGFELEKGC